MGAGVKVGGGVGVVRVGGGVGVIVAVEVLAKIGIPLTMSRLVPTRQITPKAIAKKIPTSRLLSFGGVIFHSVNLGSGLAFLSPSTSRAKEP